MPPLTARQISHSTGPDFSPVAERVYASSYNAEVVRWIPARALQVLDVGCGAGGNARQIVQSAGAEVDGITCSPAEALDAARVCRRVWTCDLESGLPADAHATYDAVLCSHVLEHLRFPERILAQVRERLRPNGRLIVAIPNLLYYKNRLSLLMGRFEYTAGGLMDSTHFRWYTASTLHKLLCDSGFRVERLYGSGALPLRPLRALLPKSCGRLDEIAGHAWPGFFGWQLVATALRN